jgi:hypothetical protein
MKQVVSTFFLSVIILWPTNIDTIHFQYSVFFQCQVFPILFFVATDQVLNLKTFAQLEKDLILIAYDSKLIFQSIH